MRDSQERSLCVSRRAFKRFCRLSNRMVPVIFVILLLSFIFCATCVALPYYLKGTKHPALYNLVSPLLGLSLLNVLCHYYRLFPRRNPYQGRVESQLDLPLNRDYCDACDDYVSGLYGHVPWLGICISLRNARPFLALLLHCILYSTISAAITVPLAVQLLWEPSLLYRICYESRLGPLSLLYCHSWNSSQSFMLSYLLVAASALTIAISLVPVLLLYARFILNGWSFSAPKNRSWISLFDRNFMHKFLRISDDGVSWWRMISTVSQRSKINRIKATFRLSF
ncbi:hypothetical protein PENTCL1PPCAC_9475, partial [Pristionchus entomophagus]